MPVALTIAVSAQCKDEAQADAVAAKVKAALIELKALGVNVGANEHRSTSGQMDLTPPKAADTPAA